MNQISVLCGVRHTGIYRVSATSKNLERFKWPRNNENVLEKRQKCQLKFLFENNLEKPLKFLHEFQLKTIPKNFENRQQGPQKNLEIGAARPADNLNLAFDPS